MVFMEFLSRKGRGLYHLPHDDAPGTNQVVSGAPTRWSSRSMLPQAIVDDSTIVDAVNQLHSLSYIIGPAARPTLAIPVDGRQDSLLLPLISDGRTLTGRRLIFLLRI